MKNQKYCNELPLNFCSTKPVLAPPWLSPMRGLVTVGQSQGMHSTLFTELFPAVAMGCYGKRYLRWRKPAMIGQLSFRVLQFEACDLKIFR